MIVGAEGNALLGFVDVEAKLCSDDRPIAFACASLQAGVGIVQSSAASVLIMGLRGTP